MTIIDHKTLIILISIPKNPNLPIYHLKLAHNLQNYLSNLILKFPLKSSPDLTLILILYNSINHVQ